MQLYGGLEIVFFLLMIVFSYLMVRGMKINNRGMMLPWLFGMAFLIFLQILFGIWLLYGYYIYVMITNIIVYLTLPTKIIAAPIGDGLLGAVDLDGIQRESKLWLFVISFMFLEELPKQIEMI
jgi:hypothetical protein